MEFSNEILEGIWKDRYRKNNETLDENFRRVAKYVATNESEEEEFYNVMKDVLFLPAGRTMSNSGVGRDLTLNNCFVAPQIKDDLSDIFSKVALGAKTHQKGGGIGYDFSQLRPKNSPTSNDAIASGAISFMDVFNAQTATILQGNRRGANMGVMNVYNMDILDFITAKSYDEGKLNHFNVSVMVDDEFITAVKNDENVFLHHPVYNEDGEIERNPDNWIYSKEVSAKEIWEQIMQRAYDNGEPGVFFYDNLNKDNNLWYVENIVCSNPCAEYLAGTIYGNDKNGNKLNPNEFGGACNLGSLFLHNFVENPFTEHAMINYNKLEKTIFTAVRMLDNIIDINKFPDKIYENYQKSFRTIGLGITGLADMLTMLNIKYNSDEALVRVSRLMDFIALNTYKASIELAKEKGEFPLLNREKFVESGFIKRHCECLNYKEWLRVRDDILKYGIRNAKMLSVAPTGTLSLTFGNNCSSGLEPIFSLEYERKVKVGGQAEENVRIVPMRDYAYGEWLKVKDSPDCIVDRDVFVTALEMTVDEHVNMLAEIAYHIDMSCSKTINVPSDYSYEDTKKIYEKCHDLGIKGCTIFRPNEIRQGILITDKDKNAEEITPKPLKDIPRGYIIQANDDVIGKKRKLMTGCGSLHCTAFFDPVTGELMETYLSKGSTGGCNNFMIGLSRLISLSARAGCDIHTIVDQLNSCGTCPSYAVRTATKHDTSKGSCCPIAVGNALLDMYEEMQRELNETIEEELVHLKEEKVVKKILHPCPECGEELSFEGGCNICKSCGYTKCE